MNCKISIRGSLASSTFLSYDSVDCDPLTSSVLVKPTGCLILIFTIPPNKVESKNDENNNIENENGTNVVR